MLRASFEFLGRKHLSGSSIFSMATKQKIGPGLEKAEWLKINLFSTTRRARTFAAAFDGVQTSTRALGLRRKTFSRIVTIVWDLPAVL